MPVPNLPGGELADDDTGASWRRSALLLEQLGQTLPSVTANHVDDGAGGKTRSSHITRESNEPQQNGQ